MARFLCAGDLHLGAGADLGREPGERLDEQEAVMARLVEVANELDAPLLFAGDAWERRRPTPAELLAFFHPLDKAKHGPLIVQGNHDVEAFARPTGYDLRGYVHCSAPEVVDFGGALIACLPWTQASHLVALEDGGDRDELHHRLAAGLVEIARGLFATMDPSKPRILLGHWSVGGATTPTGAPTDLFREPVLNLAELEAIGFDAMVFGHIHRPQMLGERGFYVGSPMPLNFGEVGCDHVAWLLDVEPGKFSAFQIPIESRRLVTLSLRYDSPEDVLDLGPGDVDDAIVKVKIAATEEMARRLDVGAIKREIVDAGAYKVWAIQTEIDRADVARGVVLDETIDDDEAMRRWLELNFDGDPENVLTLHRGYMAQAAA